MLSHKGRGGFGFGGKGGKGHGHGGPRGEKSAPATEAAPAQNS